MALLLRLATATFLVASFSLAAQGKKAVPKPAPRAAAPAKKTALDKATLEAYVRHLFVWDKNIAIAIDDPKPAPMPGFFEYTIHATAGPAKQDEVFFISKDGQKIMRGSVYDVSRNPFERDISMLKTDSAASLGTAGAPVVLVLFSDFQCPYCKDEAKKLRTNLLSAYPKQVRLYFKDFPLDAIHPWARAAAIAGRCVFQQNGAAFWSLHDWMFENQSSINAENLKAKVMEWAKSNKDVDVLQLTRCMDTKATDAEVAKSVGDRKSVV